MRGALREILPLFQTKICDFPSIFQTLNDGNNMLFLHDATARAIEVAKIATAVSKSKAKTAFIDMYVFTS